MRIAVQNFDRNNTICLSLALPSSLSKPPSLLYKQSQLHVTVSHDSVFVVIYPLLAVAKL